MSTLFVGEGNIGSVPEYQEFNTNPDEPRRLLRLNVYFDNPVPREGGYEDRGGYWAPVELWNRDAEHWATLFQKGMRVLVEGRTVKEEWEDSEDNARVTFKVEARRIGILPHRLASVTMREKASDNASTSRKGGARNRHASPGKCMVLSGIAARSAKSLEPYIQLSGQHWLLPLFHSRRAFLCRSCSSICFTSAKYWSRARNARQCSGLSWTQAINRARASSLSGSRWVAMKSS